MSSEPLSIRTLIVDDDTSIVGQITDVLSHFKEFDFIETCSSGIEAIERIQGHRPNLVFLETELADMTGFDLMQRIFPMSAPQFVFVTKNKHHAVKAFEYFAFDYIVKPFTPERLHLTLLKVKEDFYKKSGEQLQEKLNALFRYVSGTQPNSEQKSDRNGSALLPVKMGGRIYFIREEDVRYIVASGYYIEIYANGKKHLLRQSLRGIIEKLDSEKFLRIHRSVIISLKYLKEITRQGASDFNAKMDDGASFKISKSYKGNVFEQIGIGS
jgi:two-component system, LytTR family, response regulator